MYLKNKQLEKKKTKQISMYGSFTSSSSKQYITVCACVNKRQTHTMVVTKKIHKFIYV